MKMLRQTSVGFRSKYFPKVPIELVERFKYILRNYDRYMLTEPDDSEVSTAAVLTGVAAKQSETKPVVLSADEVRRGDYESTVMIISEK